MGVVLDVVFRVWGLEVGPLQRSDDAIHAALAGTENAGNGILGSGAEGGAICRIERAGEAGDQILNVDFKGIGHERLELGGTAP
jgi:hypothetical protein